MSIDANGNDLDAVSVPVTGFVAVQLSGTAVYVTPEDGAKTPFVIPTGYKKIGLLTDKGAPQDDSKSDDDIELWQTGYKIRGDVKSRTLEVVTAELNDTVRTLTEGVAPDANGMPAISAAGASLVQTLSAGIIQNLPVFGQAVLVIVSSLATFLLQNLPYILQAAAYLVTQLAQGIVVALPMLAQGVVTLVQTLVADLQVNLPAIIQSGIGLMSTTEAIAQTAATALSQATSQQTGPTGSTVTHNADGTKTITGSVLGTDSTGTSVTTATHVGDTTPPGVPTGVTAWSGDGSLHVSWDGTLTGGIPADFDHVTLLVDGAAFATLAGAGSATCNGMKSTCAALWLTPRARSPSLSRLIPPSRHSGKPRPRAR